MNEEIQISQRQEEIGGPETPIDESQIPDNVEQSAKRVMRRSQKNQVVDGSWPEPVNGQQYNGQQVVVRMQNMQQAIDGYQRREVGYLKEIKRLMGQLSNQEQESKGAK